MSDPRCEGVFVKGTKTLTVIWNQTSAALKFWWVISKSISYLSRVCLATEVQSVQQLGCMVQVERVNSAFTSWIIPWLCFVLRVQLSFIFWGSGIKDFFFFASFTVRDLLTRVSCSGDVKREFIVQTSVCASCSFLSSLHFTDYQKENLKSLSHRLTAKLKVDGTVKYGEISYHKYLLHSWCIIFEHYSFDQQSNQNTDKEIKIWEYTYFSLVWWVVDHQFIN